MKLRKLLALAVALAVGGLPISVLAKNDGSGSSEKFVDPDTCEEYGDEFYKLKAPGDLEIMPRFRGIPDDLPEPGPMPDGAVLLPRRTKCWMWAQLLMAQAYPQVADDITRDMMKRQREYYEARIEELERVDWTMPAMTAGGGLLLGLLLTLVLVR